MCVVCVMSNMIDVRASRLRQLLTIAKSAKDDGKDELEIRKILNRHCIKIWQLSYNARLDYINTVMLEYDDA